jgi:hypothetical protein
MPLDQPVVEACPRPPLRLQAAMARRSWSASPALKPAATIAMLHHLLLEDRHAQRALAGRLAHPALRVGRPARSPGARRR